MRDTARNIPSEYWAVAQYEHCNARRAKLEPKHIRSSNGSIGMPMNTLIAPCSTACSLATRDGAAKVKANDDERSILEHSREL